MVRKGLIAVSVCSIALSAIAQSAATIVAEGDLKKVVREAYLFRGMSATTQLRNSSAIDYPDDFYVMAGLVDTSGYSSDLRARTTVSSAPKRLLSLAAACWRAGASATVEDRHGWLHCEALSRQEVPELHGAPRIPRNLSHNPGLRSEIGSAGFGFP